MGLNSGPEPSSAAGGLLSPREINAGVYTRETQRFLFIYFYEHLLSLSSSHIFG